MAVIIFDASTLILLAKIEMHGTFVSGFGGKVFIPEKVREEVSTDGREETPSIVKLIRDNKIQVLKVKDKKLVRQLVEDFSIHEGEAAVLALALEHKADIVATDDRNAIRACKALKLDFTSAIAVLIRAFEKGVIDKEEALIKLEKLASVARYKRAIIEDARERIERGVSYGDENIKHTHG